MKTDRFDSSEDYEWHPECFSQGVRARLGGYKIQTNPYQRSSAEYAHKSWNAGWADADMDAGAPKEPVY
jgi:hypothetical protein